MRVVPFRAEHLDRMAEQETEKRLAGYVEPGMARALQGPWAKTVLDGDEVLLCGGVHEIWAQRGYLWSYVAATAGRRFIVLHRLTQAFVDEAPFRRIEAAVQWRFEEGHRWMKLLGFTCETPDKPMRAFLPNGGDAALYAKVK